MTRIVAIVTFVSFVCLSTQSFGTDAPKVDSITVLAVAALAETYCPNSRGIFVKTQEALETAGLLPEGMKDDATDPSGRKTPALEARVRALDIEVDGMGRKAFCRMMRQQKQ